MKRYVEHLEFSEENDPATRNEISRRYCRGWEVASQEYREELKATFSETGGSEHAPGVDFAGLREARWRKRLSSLLRAAGKTADDAPREAKSVRWKVKIAKELRATSTASNAWTAENLVIGHPSRVCNLIRQNV